MMDFIRAENIKSLVSYVVEKFGNRLSEVDYVDTFSALRLKIRAGEPFDCFHKQYSPLAPELCFKVIFVLN